MLRLALILFLLVLIFGAGVIFTSPRLDGPKYALQTTTAKIKIANLAVLSYVKGHLRIPSDTEGLQFLAEKPAIGGDRPYLLAIPTDFWGHPLIYKVLDTKLQEFMIYSAGPDGVDNGGAGDDVIAGKKNYKCELYGSCLTAKDHLYQAFVIATLVTLLTSIGIAIYSIKNTGKERPRAP